MEQSKRLPGTLGAPDLRKMKMAYLEALLWSSCDGDGDPLDRRYTIDSIDSESVERAEADCREFIRRTEGIDHGLDSEALGHDMALTRNRHGTGFWDRGLGKIGEELTEICHEMGEVTIYESEYRSKLIIE